MPRHRGIYNFDNPEPYELSRSRIENFIQCPACFYMQQVEGIKFPSIPGFNLNEATDVLLKRDFDLFRGKNTTHPFLINQGFRPRKDVEPWQFSIPIQWNADPFNDRNWQFQGTVAV